MELPNKTILYVDDEFINQKLFEAHFCKNYNIIISGSAFDGLKILETNPVNLLITDYKMPGMNGIEFIKEVKKIFPELKCIIISGFIESEVTNEKEQQLVNDYLIKPWKKEAVIKAIDKALAL